MYDDPKNWCYTFQRVVFDTMVENHMTFNSGNIKIMERSLFSALYFCEINHTNKRISTDELRKLCGIYDNYMRDSAPVVDLLGRFFLEK